MTQAAPRKSDLSVRVLSAVVMVAITGAAWFGGAFVWTLFVVIVGVACFGELGRLVLKAFASWPMRALWIVFGILYIAIAVSEIQHVPFSVLYHGDVPNGGRFIGLGLLISLLGLVVCTDIGAYFSGRTIGGPKIVPAISPSKTWAGLIGGMVCAGAWGVFAVGLPGRLSGESTGHMTATLGLAAAASGAAMAVVAQIGDFWESWLKRRAGVKDSSRLIPGHGGIFDRLDGLLAVTFVSAIAGDWMIFGELLRR